MLSQTSKYALNILSFLAGSPGVRTRAEQIAKHTGVPANYLSKILNQLRKQGFVESEKGWGGGFRVRTRALNRPIRDIVEIFDGVQLARAPKECIFGLPRCDEKNPCPLHSYWEKIRGIEDEMIQRTRVRDLARPAP